MPRWNVMGGPRVRDVALIAAGVVLSVFSMIAERAPKDRGATVRPVRRLHADLDDIQMRRAGLARLVSSHLPGAARVRRSALNDGDLSIESIRNRLADLEARIDSWEAVHRKMDGPDADAAALERAEVLGIIIAAARAVAWDDGAEVAKRSRAFGALDTLGALRPSDVGQLVGFFRAQTDWRQRRELLRAVRLCDATEWLDVLANVVTRSSHNRDVRVDCLMHLARLTPDSPTAREHIHSIARRADLPSMSGLARLFQRD